ncbi:hypothetical protein PQR02_00355 [Paraburkholderia sediminicola]|uniref:Uncharacterized protein n=1 Tax=Paraburkholderia rhynchosiae TaxID=487049 RepID=A0ACC7NEU5_9BURK
MIEPVYQKQSIRRRGLEVRDIRFTQALFAGFHARRTAFASFISRVNAAVHAGFRYHPENVAHAARLSGACRTADGNRPARLSPIAVPLAEARRHPRQT